jgi:hypothetical protein
MRRIREIAAELPEGEFYTILDALKSRVPRSYSELRGLPEAGECDACGDREIRGVMLTQFHQKRDAKSVLFRFEVDHEHHPVLDLSSSSGLDDRHRSLL